MSIQGSCGTKHRSYHTSAFYNSPDVARLLIEHGAEINPRDRDGKTPLHGTVYHNYVDIARTLIKHGADIHLKDNDGSTPLALAAEWASRRKLAGIARLLIEQGANTDGIDLDWIDDQETLDWMDDQKDG